MELPREIYSDTPDQHRYLQKSNIFHKKDGSLIQSLRAVTMTRVLFSNDLTQKKVELLSEEESKNLNNCMVRVLIYLFVLSLLKN